LSHFVSLFAGSEVHPDIDAVSAPGRGSNAAARGKIDELVFAHLAKAGVEPAGLSSDEVFLRRASLDVIGTLPTAQEAVAFLANRNTGRRTALINELFNAMNFPSTVQ
jgi:hypothetical protein